MKKSFVLGLLWGLLAAACSSGARVDAHATGHLSMALSAPGPNAVTYHLRSALFSVAGPSLLSLDSESDPNADSLSAEVNAGDYQVGLQEGWYIEREAGGATTRVNAVLQSQNPVGVTVAENGDADVVFTFAVNNLPVVFSTGRLHVSIAVNECDGTPGEWAGCRGNGCAVCSEQLVDYPLYAQNHPSCVVNPTCDGQFFTCNAACPAPTDADRAPPTNSCDGTPGEWDGCRGTGCWVCSEKLVGYPRYAQNHPNCVVNTTCDGQFYTCNAACPAPTDADRAPPTNSCDGTPGEWDGCRGTGCWVCSEKLVDYPGYAQNHPDCVVNTTCDGQFYTCNAACPAPTDADRVPPADCASDSDCASGSSCQMGVCVP